MVQIFTLEVIKILINIKDIYGKIFWVGYPLSVLEYGVQYVILIFSQLNLNKYMGLG